MLTFNDQIIVVLGGGGRLSSYLTKSLCQSTATIILVGRNETAMQEICKSSLEINAKIQCEICDLSDEAQIAKTLSNIERIHKRIDILISSVGEWYQDDITNHSGEKIKDLFNSNVISVMMFISQALKLIKKSPYGQILNIISIVAIGCHANQSVYSASKSALMSFTDSLSLDLENENIRVMGLFPDSMTPNPKGTLIKMSDVVEIIEFMLLQPKELVLNHVEVKNFAFTYE